MPTALIALLVIALAGCHTPTPDASALDTPGYARDVAVSGGRAYVADGKSGLRIIDVSDPANPREVGRSEGRRSARTISVSGSYAYVGDYAGLSVFDVSIPSSPREVASHETPAKVARVWLAKGAAYVAAYEAGLMIFGLEALRPAEEQF